MTHAARHLKIPLFLAFGIKIKKLSDSRVIRYTRHFLYQLETCLFSSASQFSTSSKLLKTRSIFPFNTRKIFSKAIFPTAHRLGGCYSTSVPANCLSGKQILQPMSKERRALFILARLSVDASSFSQRARERWNTVGWATVGGRLTRGYDSLARSIPRASHPGHSPRPNSTGMMISSDNNWKTY